MKTQLSVQEVIAQLVNEGLMKPVENETVAAQLISSRPHGSLPWYVRLFVGLSAWIAAILITAFLFIVRILEEDQALYFGLAFCVIAVLLDRINRHNTFIGQLYLALSLTGQALAIIGLSPFSLDLSIIVLIIVVLELTLIWLHRDRVLRFISTLIITISILVLILDTNNLEVIHVFVFLLAAGSLFIYLTENRLQILGLDDLISPIGYGITVSLLGLLIMPLLDEFKLQWQVTAMSLFVLLLFLITQIIRDLGYTFRNPVVGMVMLACALLLIPAIRMPGLLGALLILLLGFWRNNRVLMGLSSVFLVFYIWAYYYSLEWTLLAKSLVLLGSGIILLSLRFFLVRSRAGDRA